MNTLKQFLSIIQESLIANKINRYLLISQLVMFGISLVVWIYVIERRDIFVYSVTDYFPLQIFCLIFMLHLILSVYSYNRDKYISYLLLGATQLYILVIISLEIFYILNR